MFGVDLVFCGLELNTKSLKITKCVLFVCFCELNTLSFAEARGTVCTVTSALSVVLLWEKPAYIQ